MQMGINEIKGILEAIIAGDKRYQKRVAERRIYSLMGILMVTEEVRDKKVVANALYHIYNNLMVIYEDNEQSALNYFIILVKLVYGDDFDNTVIKLIYNIIKHSKQGNYTMDEFVGSLGVIHSNGGNTYVTDIELMQEYKKRYESELSRSEGYRKYIDEETVAKHEYDKLMHKLDECNEAYDKLESEKREIEARYNEVFADTMEYKTRVATEMVTNQEYQELQSNYQTMEQSYNELCDKYIKLKEDYGILVEGADKERGEAREIQGKLEQDLKAERIALDNMTKEYKALLTENTVLKERVKELDEIEVVAVNGDSEVADKEANVKQPKKRGRKKGEVNEPWIALGLSRSTYYRRKNAGLL